MKILPLKTLILSNAPLKIISLILGYSFWHIATVNTSVTMSYSVPLCFDIPTKRYTISAPENVTIFLHGKRSDFSTLDCTSLAAHVTLDKISPGKHHIILTEHNLFLPSTIALKQYKPSNLTVTVTDNVTA